MHNGGDKIMVEIKQLWGWNRNGDDENKDFNQYLNNYEFFKLCIMVGINIMEEIK